MAPRSRGVDGLKTKPSRAKGDAGSVEVANTEPAQPDRLAHLGPRHEATSDLGVAAPLPKELADDSDRLLEDRGRDGHGHENVHRDSRHDVPNQGKALATQK